MFFKLEFSNLVDYWWYRSYGKYKISAQYLNKYACWDKDTCMGCECHYSILGRFIMCDKKSIYLSYKKDMC